MGSDSSVLEDGERPAGEVDNPQPLRVKPRTGQSKRAQRTTRQGQVVAPAELAGVPANGAKSTGSKSSAKSSPRYQDGDSIDLPEIPTDLEDEDERVISDWENSPALNRELLKQEKIDPASIFGLRTGINLEEMFKSNERKGSARTSWLVCLVFISNRWVVRG